MRTWSTYIKAISPIDGHLKTYRGEPVQAPTPRLAREWCDLNGKGYLHISDELVQSNHTGQVIDYDYQNN